MASPAKLGDGTVSGPSGKVRLSPESIVAAGLELAEQQGTRTISVRALGARIDADPTAVYRHFRNKQELMQALLDQLTVRSVAAVRAPADQWQDRLRELAAATLDEFVRHPAIAVEATVLTTHGPGELDAIELMLDAFSRAGLSDDEIVHHYALMASHMLSVGAGIAHGLGRRGASELQSSPWFEGTALGRASNHPLIAKFGPQIMGFRDRELFFLGVEAVIDSAQRDAGVPSSDR